MTKIIALDKVFDVIRKTAAVLILASALLTPVSTFAQNSTTASANPLKNRLETRKTILQERLESKKATIEGKIATRAATLKAKLQLFKDQRKASLVDRINTTLSMINQKRTEMMNKHLDVMSNILTRLEDRVNQASQNGKDATAALQAIDSAKTAIQKAREAVANQKDMDYTITVQSETTVKQDAMKAREALHTDLRGTRKLIIDAKQAVAHAITTAATTLGGTNGQ